MTLSDKTEAEQGGLVTPDETAQPKDTKSLPLVREFKIYAGYDKRNSDPKKNYGIHGCELVFYLHNRSKTRWVQFKLFTDWLPRNVQDERMGKDVSGMHPNVLQAVVGIQPTGADLGYHAERPQYKGQSRYQCDLRRSGYCYYDGSGLAADGLRDVMLNEGSDGVWRKLENYYHEIFTKRSDLVATDKDTSND